MDAQTPNEPQEAVQDVPEAVEPVESTAPVSPTEDGTLDKLTQALRGGNDVETAAHFAGVSLSQLYRWLEVGKYEAERRAAGYEADPSVAACLEVWESLRKARAEAIVRNVAYVQTAAKQGHWQAAAWWLERTVPETYSRTKPNAKQPDTDSQGSISGG